MKAIKALFGRKSPEPDLRVLMVCSGNICRSPTAEAVLRAKLHAAGLGDRVRVDSAGTHGFHAKDPPDPRAQAHAAKRGYDLSALRARRVTRDDFDAFDRIYAMDGGHLNWLEAKRPEGARAQLALLMTHAPGAGHREVPDPYYGSERDFQLVLDLVEPACDGLVADLRQQLR